MNYRHTKVAGKVGVREIPAANVGNKIGVTARKRGGIAAVDNGDSGRIRGVSGGGGGSDFKRSVSNDCIVVIGKVEEVLHHEMVTSSSTTAGCFIVD